MNDTKKSARSTTAADKTPRAFTAWSSANRYRMAFRLESTTSTSSAVLRLDEPHSGHEGALDLVNRKGILGRVVVAVTEQLTIDDERAEAEPSRKLRLDEGALAEYLLVSVAKRRHAAEHDRTVDQVVDDDVIGEQRQQRLEVVRVERVELALDDLFGERHVTATLAGRAATRNGSTRSPLL